MGGGVSTDFKSSNRIEISRLVQVLLNFEWFRGPPGVWGGWMGVGGWGVLWMGVGVARGCTPTTCTCMCMPAHAHARTRVLHHRESPGFPQIQWGRPFAWNYHAYHACMCVHACTCMCTCGGHPPTTPTHIHPPPPPTPKSCRKPKTPKFDNSWTNQDNSILFDDSLPLNIPELI